MKPTRVLLALLLTVVTAGIWVSHGVRRAFAAASQQTSSQIELTLNYTGKPLRLAIPAFLAPDGDATLTAAGGTMAAVLWADLNFEDEFALVSREATLKVPPAPALDAIPTDRWAELGADMVVFATLQRAGETVTVNLQLVGVKTSEARKIGYAHTYTDCTVANARACAHEISDGLHKDVRHLDGVAQTRLAFTSDRDAERLNSGRRGAASGPGAGKEIYICDYDGENQRRITANQALNLAPAWAPDGHTLAYVSYVSQSPDIYVSDILKVRQPQRPVGGGPGENTLPAFSADGNRLAFSSTRGGNWDIWLVNRDGSGLKNLTNNTNPRVINNSPTWSPSGNQLAFTSDRTGSNQIYLMNADGTGLEKLTSDTGVDRPTWSPAPFTDIAYTSGSLSGHDINLIDVATRQVRVLTSGLGDNGSPSFAPNGLHIAFVTSRWGKDQIAIVDRKGNLQLHVTTVGTNTYPSWSRSPRP